MLYGANGYTGQLMVEEAARRGERPVLAGRRVEAIRPLAERHGLEHRAFDLSDPAAVAEQLADVDAIALAAGPFSATSAPVVEACLRSGTHYTDITGEIDVFEACAARDADAKARGVVLLPGAGFDVVPTDCVAASLHAALPDANELVLAFRGDGASSRGTTKTMIEALPHGGKVRRDGRLVTVPTAHETREIPFRDKTRLGVAIPWGDVSTAYQSTGIPNITVFLALPKGQVRGMRALRHAAPVLGTSLVQRGLKALVEATMTGPDAQLRERASSTIWGQVRNAAGDRVEATLTTPEGYTLTARTAVDATLRLANGEVEAGAKTPSLAFGADYITCFEDCDLRVGAVS
ncbi:MAG: saccharopine dehydrogenase NADP-binding domain-containing protein [Polyangiales bacterium]